MGDFVEYLKLAGRFRGLSSSEIVGLVKIFTQSAAEFLDEWFESEQVKVTLATDGVIGANGGPRSPGTAYILLHHCMGGVNGHRGLWGFVRGGMGSVSNAIADSARSRGVVIRTNAVVGKILVRDGRARGVVLAEGEEILARVVASNLDPRRTFLELMDAADLPGEFLDGIRKFRSEGTSLKMNLALRGLPEFTALPGTPGPQHRATMHHLPQRRIHRARLGRRQVRPPLPIALDRDDHPHHVRSGAGPRRPPHHGDLSAIRALHAEGFQLGSRARRVIPNGFWM